MEKWERWLFDQVKGKSLLHIGCLGNWKNYLENLPNQWIFHKFTRCAKKVSGLDLDSEGVEAAQKKGFHSICEGNAEKFNLTHPCQVIFAGDLIEHLDNPGLFLKSCKENLTPEGVLILTTPNPFALNLLLKGLRGKGDEGVFEEHTCLFSPKTLTLLLSRNGYQVKKIVHFTPKARYGFFPGLKTQILGAMGYLQPTFHGSFLVAAQPIGDGLLE